VGHVKIISVISESPSFAFVGKLPQQAKITEVINKPYLRSPGELKDPFFHNRNTFAEILLSEIHLLQALSRLDVDFPQPGAPVQTRALIKKSIMVDQPLRVSVLIVRIRMHHRKRIFRRTLHSLGRAGRLASVTITGGKKN